MESVGARLTVEVIIGPTVCLSFLNDTASFPNDYNASDDQKQKSSHPSKNIRLLRYLAGGILEHGVKSKSKRLTNLASQEAVLGN